MDLTAPLSAEVEAAVLSARYPTAALAAGDERMARMVWSGIAEPADRLAGALVAAMGAADALAWAAQAFSAPIGPAGRVVDPPSSELSSAADGSDAAPQASAIFALWRQLHRRLQPRLRDFDLDRELELLETVGGRVIVPADPQWPASFVGLEERSPFALWVVGSLPGDDQKKVSIVGARAATSQGTSLATALAFDAANAGLTVISGGAYGIDAAAHRGALRSLREDRPTGRSVGNRFSTEVPTVAVLCGGLDNLYPAGNIDLLERIVKLGGALVTEMPPSSRPARWRFLERNRLISAWSDFVLVVEAGLRSGALATANRALDLGVAVGAVPGAVASPVAAGPNELIKNGAVVVTDIDDILFQVTGTVRPEVVGESPVTSSNASDNRSPSAPKARSITDDVLEGLAPAQRRAWDALPSSGFATAHSVASEGGMTEAETGGALLALRLAGLVDTSGSKWARRATISVHGEG